MGEARDSQGAADDLEVGRGQVSAHHISGKIQVGRCGGLVCM